MEQLGYGSECATWRNFFLAGAKELRDGNFGTPVGASTAGVLTQLTPEQIFDALAISVNGPRAWDLDLALDVTFVDTHSNHRLTLRNGVLIHRRRAVEPETATVTLSLSGKPRLLSLAAGDFTSAGLEITGDPSALQSLLGVLDRPDPDFNIIVP